MNDPNYTFSDGTELDCLEEAQHKVNALLDDYRDFSIKINEDEIRFTQLGGCGDVQRNSR